MKEKIKAKKHLGQNFLIDKNVINKILEVAKVENKDIIEIGPGQGAITQGLANLAKSLVAYEIDKDMINILETKILNSNFTLENQDFLKAEFNWETKKSVVANLPYYITSKILFKIFENIEKFNHLTIMVQDEVANRLIAQVNTFNYGKLAISAQYLANIKKEFIVYPNSFSPAPKVNSAIVTLNFRDNLKFNEVKDFLFFIKQCFSMRRKTLENNLKNFLNKNIILELFEKFNLSPKIRPQEITKEEYEKIFIFLKEKQYV